MVTGEITKKLAAILAADIAGYTSLMESDTDGTVAAWHAARADVIDPGIANFDGRIVKHTGDGFLAEFSTAQDAVRCAINMQAGLKSSSLEFRIGINLGDIIDDGEDIHGEGVNIAARLESLADPGGIFISGSIFDAVRNRIEANFEDLGEKSVKHVTAPIRVYRINNSGSQSPAKDTSSAATAPALDQDIRFCDSADAVTIAWASVGDGPPLMKAPNWMNHLEYDWQSPILGHLLHAMAADHRLVRFDQRGNGLSDRNLSEISFDNMIDDMAVVADAAGLDRFPLLSLSQGCAYSIAYANRYPERVSKLVLYGGFAKGMLARGQEEAKQRAEMEHMMISQGWGQNNPAFRQFFSSSFMPEATKEQMDRFNELQFKTISTEQVLLVRDVVNNIDVEDMLAHIKVPTLVLHCRDDGIAPFEGGRRMAAKIPNAKFVALEGKNHLILEDEPAWPRFIDEVKKFLAED
jgi:class 3 adenylate cyclase/pimeloyl-ACP methyl ester carboxylesterase